MIYLLGGSGYVGRAYQAALARKGLPFRSVRRSDFDYTDPVVLREALERDRPDFVINAAGHTGTPNVDACEQHKAECLAANAVLPGVIAQACAEAGLPWGHVSSGCIYNGTRPDGGGFTEADPPNFTFRANWCSFYSGSKALGEEVLAGRPRTYIWRLRIPFNHADHPRNYLTKLLQYPRLLDVTNSLSDLDEFCAATLACWEQRAPFGTYNVVNPGRISTREVVDLIRQIGISRKEFSFFASEDEFMRLAAKTPRSNCVLDPAKIMRLGIPLTDVRTAVIRALENWQRPS